MKELFLKQLLVWLKFIIWGPVCLSPGFNNTDCSRADAHSRLFTAACTHACMEIFSSKMIYARIRNWLYCFPLAKRIHVNYWNNLKKARRGQRIESFNISPSISLALQPISGTLEVSSNTCQEENLPISGVVWVKERGCSCLSLLSLPKLQFPAFRRGCIDCASFRMVQMNISIGGTTPNKGTGSKCHTHCWTKCLFGVETVKSWSKWKMP